MTLFEISKFLIPAILSSSLVGYYFQRRLKRLESYREAITQLAARALHGAESLERWIKCADSIVREINAAAQEARSGIRDPQNLEALAEKLFNSADSLREALEGHRIYITRLIPFDGSSVLIGSLSALAGSLQFLSKADEADVGDLLTLVEKSGDDFLLELKRLRSEIVGLKDDIMNGRPI